MAKYLKEFNTHSEYTTYINGQDKLLPNVSYCIDNNEVHYNPLRLDVITYAASAKLDETTDTDSSGLHTNAFNTTIKSHTFENGVGIIEFNANVTSIGERAFYSCDSLTSVTIPDSVTSIGESAFNYCSGLTSINIPSGLTTIGVSAFQYCTGLTSIDIPNSVTSIGGSAFKNCQTLTNITIGNNVTSIGQNAFGSCPSIESFNISAVTPPIIDYIFSVNCNETGSGEGDVVPIYVPTGSVDTYKEDENWTIYACSIYGIEDESE